ncbi:hypothetical protein HYS96_03865 [Candidatus Daviesbacteria bacterium]|nr:hypothetical protein [Candidatus Daviesbacteria bacterium]
MAEEAIRRADQTNLRAVVEELLHCLNPQERQVMELRFGFADGGPKTLEEIGRGFRLTRERIRQVESLAFAKLKAQANTAQLKDYFLSLFQKYQVSQK